MLQRLVEEFLPLLFQAGTRGQPVLHDNREPAGGGAVKVHGTAVVWLPVSDTQRALSFYEERLGLRKLSADGDWAMLDANGLSIGLNARESAAGSGGAVIAFRPEGGLDAAVEQLRADGVDVPGEISEHPWGRVATLNDPDGNDIQLYEPPDR
jgi:predicted enzyme related to lactoylglutathione lyase